jgi:hypothetical protein
VQHPFKNGNTGMKDHYESRKCTAVRRQKFKDPKIMQALQKQGEKVCIIVRILVRGNLNNLGCRDQ